MCKGRNLLGYLLVTIVLLGMIGPTRAEPLIPLYEGQVFTYHRWDTSNPAGWSVLMEVMGQEITLGSHEYFHVQVWNYENDSEFTEEGYHRSTEQAAYVYGPDGREYVAHQKAPVGTRWSVAQEYEGYRYRTAEIVAIESVTVPYGTFDGAYKHRFYLCYDPDNLSLGKSADSYQWIVPGIGPVKQETYFLTDYPPAIMELVGMSVAPVYRFWSPVYSRHFYTISEAEKRKLIDTLSHVWSYERIAYYTFAVAGESTAHPIYRFWSNALSAHFYTISETERDNVIKTYAGIWTYEGPVFYAYPEGSQPASASAVYRFWSNTLGCHFYTMSEAERDKLISLYPFVWAYEGIAWYANE